MKKLALLTLMLLAACSQNAGNNANAPSNSLTQGRPDIFGKKSELQKPAGEDIKLHPSWFVVSTGEQTADQVSYNIKGRHRTVKEVQAAMTEYAGSKADGLPGLNADDISDNPVVLRMKPNAPAQQAMAFIEMMVHAKIAPFYFVLEGGTERIFKLRLPVDGGLEKYAEPPPPEQPPENEVEFPRDEPGTADPTTDEHITEEPDTDDDRSPDRPDLQWLQGTPRFPQEHCTISAAPDGDLISFTIALDARGRMPAGSVTRTELVKDDTVQDAAYNNARRDLADKLVDLHKKVPFEVVEVMCGHSGTKALRCVELVLMIDAARVAGNIVHPDKTDPWEIRFKFGEVLTRYGD
jgi:hypothetical protein